MRTVKPRCGLWMVKSKAHCGRPENHGGKCRAPEALARAYAGSYTYHKARMNGRRALLDEIKLSRGCIDCGYRKHAVALDFDHRDPAQKVADISEMLRAPWGRILAELEKCDVRCACCHRVKTHGTPEAAAPQDDGLTA